MTAIQAAQVVKENGVQLLRVRLNEPGQFDVKPAFSGKKKGWFYLDAFTASAIVAVHEALNPENRAKFEAMPLPKMCSVAFKLIK